ncbi:hypothetical protein DO72_5598 [Burkholderia pseudomallei]|nr:hypothetical protein DO72_5598 [Burkholderia pseudomallei]
MRASGRAVLAAAPPARAHPRVRRRPRVRATRIARVSARGGDSCCASIAFDTPRPGRPARRSTMAIRRVPAARRRRYALAGLHRAAGGAAVAGHVGAAVHRCDAGLGRLEVGRIPVLRRLIAGPFELDEFVAHLRARDRRVGRRLRERQGRSGERQRERGRFQSQSGLHDMYLHLSRRGREARSRPFKLGKSALRAA